MVFESSIDRSQSTQRLALLASCLKHTGQLYQCFWSRDPSSARIHRLKWKLNNLISSVLSFWGWLARNFGRALGSNTHIYKGETLGFRFQGSGESRLKAQGARWKWLPAEWFGSQF